MALENVIDEIISQAEKQKRAIIEQGKQESWKILDEATQKTKQRGKLFAEETTKLLGETERMELSSTNIRFHKMLLEAKRSILDELHNQLVERFSNMSASERKALLHKLIEKARKELPDAKYFYCNARDRELVKGLQFKDLIDCLGGVIVENSDGTIRINYTFDVLLQSVKELHLNEIAKKIF